jgi:homoaconitase/3-isopropylmalate dehydratase large subunit
MTNLAMEMGVKCAFVPPDAKTEEYLRGRMDASKRYQPVNADADAVYEKEIPVDLSKLGPMVACPHEVENTKPIQEVQGTRIDQAFLGSCANAKYEDLEVAARILKGRRVHPNVRLIITPGSKQILLEASKPAGCSPIQAAALARAMAASWPTAKFASPPRIGISLDAWEAARLRSIFPVRRRWPRRRSKA